MAIDMSRISVRAFKLSDVDDIMLWLGDERVTKSTRLKTCRSKLEALKFLKDECVHPLRRSICLNDRSIGVVWVLPHAGNERYRADLGYALGFNYWGNGIATKVVKMVLSQVFHDFTYLRRLQAYAFVDNIASQRVLEKAGFQREGLLRKFICPDGMNLVDSYLYSFCQPMKFLLWFN